MLHFIFPSVLPPPSPFAFDNRARLRSSGALYKSNDRFSPVCLYRSLLFPVPFQRIHMLIQFFLLTELQSDFFAVAFKIQKPFPFRSKTHKKKNSLKKARKSERNDGGWAQTICKSGTQPIN